MKSDFFYSKSAKLHVALGPLKMDGRVKRAAAEAGLKLSWDDEGRINNIDFDDAKKLLSALGSQMLSPVEYWLVMKDASKDKEMQASLASNRFCEWLDRVYSDNKRYIDNPTMIGKYKYAGIEQQNNCPFGRPGWMNPEGNIDLKTGHPLKVELFRERFASSWKYWSPDFSVTKCAWLAPIRGYVTSVGKPSFDLGIPVDARQPVLMIRECRKTPLNPPISQHILEKLATISEPYQRIARNLKAKKDYELFYSKKKAIISFIEKYGAQFKASKELKVYKCREEIFDILGLLVAIALGKGEMKVAERLSLCTGKLSNNNIRELVYSEFARFVESSSARLTLALKNNKDIIFVMGHKNPDTDTCICTIFEAYRNALMDSAAEYIPIVQSHKIPDEVRQLLGDAVSNNILLHTNKNYIKAKESGLARWISVDQNREPGVQKYFISIIDHHVVSQVARNQDLPKTLELTGSCTALVTNKILGMGLRPDKEIAKILYGAALMDTENRVRHKMTIKDRFIMDYLKKTADVESDNEFYSELMSRLLNTDDAKILFGRDYKEDWGFGFAVIKVKHAFDADGIVLKKELIGTTIILAAENNISKNLPLTIVRITDYADDNETVTRERVYLIFNKSASGKFIDATTELLEKHILYEFSNDARFKLRKEVNFVEFWGTGTQLSRKKTAPILEPVVGAFNEYFYSPSVKVWVRRDFLKDCGNVRKAMASINSKLSKDTDGRLNYITYPEAKVLSGKLGSAMLSLPDYWQVLDDAKKIKDIQMIESLQGSNFVEFTDSIIKEKSLLINHPDIVEGIEKNLDSFGNGKKVFVPSGKPGLIHPNEIDMKTGIPKRVRSPSEYGNPELWRYWEPDADLVIPTRSYIFLLKQPCWDGKVHLSDSYPNLGLRPCMKELDDPIVNINYDRKKLTVEIIKDGDIVKYSWKK